MPKEIKRCYKLMDLSYSSTVEQVKEKESFMIKLLQEKEVKKKKSYKQKINIVLTSANQIIEYIKKNGVPNIDDNMFNTPTKSILSQIIALIGLSFLLFCTIYALV